MPASASARSSAGAWATWGFLVGLLVVELIVDVVGFIFDIVLIPIEFVVDAVVVLSILSSTPRPSSGRRLGSGRRGALGLVALYWLLFAVFLGIAIWADYTVSGFPLIGGALLLFFSFFQFVLFGAFALFGLYLTAKDRSRASSGKQLGR